MEINIGRAENKYRYEACVNQIRKAFAVYREVFEPDTEETLVWEGEKYKLKEDGEFVSLNSDGKNNILCLEKDVKALQEFVYGEITKMKLDEEEEEEEDEDEVSEDTLSIAKHCIEANVPNMECYTLDVIGDDLYWVTKNNFTLRDANVFEEYVRHAFTYKTLWIIPREFSTLDFEKDKDSYYMISFEKGDEKPALTTAVSKLITAMKSLRVQKGIFKTDGVAISVLTDSPMELSIRYNSTEVTVALNEKTRKATCHCSSPSEKERATDTAYITKALEKYCNRYGKSDYEIIGVRNTITPKESTDELFKLFMKILSI